MVEESLILYDRFQSPKLQGVTSNTPRYDKSLAFSVRNAESGPVRITSLPMKAVLLRFCVVIAVLVMLAGCDRGQVAVVDHSRSFAGVETRDVIFHSSALDRDMTYRLYLPRDASADKRMPTVYLLHGCGTSFRDWSNYSDVGAYAARGFILVMVDGGCSYYVNAALSAKDRYEDYFVHDLISDAESRLPILRGREHRAIVGVSMGGFAAVELALARPDVFAFAGAISPAVDVPSRGFSVKRWSQSLRFRNIFGPAGSEMRLHSDPFILVKSADPSHTPYLYITAGEQESLLLPIRRFVTFLKLRSYAYEFHTRPGGHDWNEWDSQIPGCFESLITHINRP